MAFVEESLGLALAQLCKAHHQYVDLALRELGLYAGQEMVLFSLFRQEGQTQIQLSHDVVCEPPTINTMLQRMERTGLVERRRDPEDARLSRVYLTQRGRALEQPLRTLWSRCEEHLVDYRRASPGSTSAFADARQYQLAGARSASAAPPFFCPRN